MTRLSLRQIDRMSDRTLTPPDPTYAEEQAALPPHERDGNQHALGLLSEALYELETQTSCTALHSVLSELVAAYEGNGSPDQFKGWDTMTPEQRQVAMDAWRMGNAAAKADGR